MYILKISKTLKKKMLLGYKHIRLKFSTRSSKDISIKLRVNKLAEILDCTNLTAKRIVSRNNEILSLTSETFLRNAQFCSKHLKFSDIIEFPFIISLNSSLLQHRYFSLVELGCTNVTASNVLKFPQILKKSPITLEKGGITFSTENYLDKYMCLLNIDNKSDVKSRLQVMYEDGSSLWKIKETMNAEYLGSKLECSLFRTHEMFKRYPPLRVQSILNTDQLLNVLFQTFQFSSSKIFQVPNLLSLHHEIVENFISHVPSILGVDTIQMANKLPLLLRRSVDSIQKIDSILRSFNISESQLLCCPKIITFAPTTLQQRLDSLCHSEDFALLKSYKKFLWLVYYYSNLDSRLRKLKEYDIPCSISMFTVSNCNFKKYFSMSECRTYIKDVCFYLSNVFGCKESDILLKLKEYPTLHNSSLTNCNKVVEFLLEAGVTKQQILNGIGVIFYDFDVVKLYFQEMQTFPECQPFSDWLNHYNLIQLLIYKIEVDAGFRGTTLYKARGKSDDFEELSLSY